MKPIKPSAFAESARGKRARARKQPQAVVPDDSQEIITNKSSVSKRRRSSLPKTPLMIACMACGQTDVPLLMGGREFIRRLTCMQRLISLQDIVDCVSMRVRQWILRMERRVNSEYSTLVCICRRRQRIRRLLQWRAKAQGMATLPYTCNTALFLSLITRVYQSLHCVAYNLSAENVKKKKK